MLKKLTSILILAVLVFSLVSCGGKDYPPVESTEREKTTVMTMTAGGKTYEIKYELYRAFFLTMKDEVNPDGVWDEDEIKEINARIVKNAADIFSVFAVAESIGIDPYSDKYDELVKDCVKAGVLGGTVGSFTYEGFDGDYEKYLESLKEIYLNYSVQDLMLRYALLLDDIYYFYRGNVENDATIGHLVYTKDDVGRFYYGDDSVRVMSLYLSTFNTSYTRERAEEIRRSIANAKNDSEVFSIMMTHSLLGEAGDELRSGMLIGSNSLDGYYYGELTETAFNMSLFETSPVIEVTTDRDHGFYILYKIEKSDEHYEASYEDIEDAYVENEIGKIFNTKLSELEAGVKFENALELIDFSTISMDE